MRWKPVTARIYLRKSLRIEPIVTKNAKRASGNTRPGLRFVSYTCTSADSVSRLHFDETMVYIFVVLKNVQWWNTDEASYLSFGQWSSATS